MTDTQEEQLPPKKEISAEEFINIWNKKYDGVKGYEEYYRHGSEGWITVVFSDCYINSDIRIEKIKNLPNIRLVNVSIKNFYLLESSAGHFTIINSSINDIKILKESTIKGLSIDDSQTEKIDFITSIAETITIKNNSKTGFIQFHSSKVKNIWVYYGCQTGYISLGSGSKAENIEVVDSKVDDIILQNKITTGRLNIRNSAIGHLHISSETIVSDILLYHSSASTLLISNNCRAHRINIEYPHIDSKSVLIEGSIIDIIQLKLDKALQIIVKPYKNKRSQIYHLNFRGTVIPKDANIQLSQTDINHIDIDSFINYGVIVFNDIAPVENFSEYTPNNSGFILMNEQGEYSFREVFSTSKFRLTNSDIGNTQLINCDISKFSEFIYLNSKLTNIFLAATGLPTNTQILSMSNNEQLKLVLSQFKKVYENQGDSVRAGRYRAEEMEVYRDQLKGDESKFPSNPWWNNKAERANLWLNKFSNYYGNNWLKAVGWTLLFNSILYTFYCWAQGYWFGNDWETFWTLSAYSFEFLNPLRKADFLEHITKKHPGAGAIAIDYISRIIIAYFVYQTITAFRKFGKSSV